FLPILLPGIEYGIDPVPRRFNFVAAHEQRLVAAHHIHDEALVGIGRAMAEGLREAHVERNLPQSHAAGPRILDHEELFDSLIGLEADDKLVGADIAGALVEDRMRDAL